MKKTFKIDISFDKIVGEDILKFFDLEKYYREIGLKGRAMKHNISENNLNGNDYIYLAVDYVARVCWAFHKQNQIDYLNNYKKVFFDFKIDKITKEKALDIIFEYEKTHKLKSHGLVNLFGFCIEMYQGNTKLDSVFWCDNLTVIEDRSIKRKIGIDYTIENDCIVRKLLNPFKIGLFSRIQFMEHIESLNLIIFLAFNVFKDNKEKSERFIKIIDFAWDYFIKNKNSLSTPEQSNNEVYKIIDKF